MVAELRRCWALGESGTIIGLSMGLSKNSICAAARRFDLPKRHPTVKATARRVRYTEADNQTLREMHAGNRSYRDIAAALGRSCDAIHERAKALKLPRREADLRSPTGRVWTTAECDTARALRVGGMSWAQVGKVIGRAGETVRSHFRYVLREGDPAAQPRPVDLHMVEAAPAPRKDPAPYSAGHPVTWGVLMELTPCLRMQVPA